MFGAAGTGLDVLSEWGELIMRIEVGGEINNFQFARPEADEIWCFGPAGIFRVSGLSGIHGLVDE